MEGRIYQIILALALLWPANLYTQEYYKVEKLPFSERHFDDFAPVPFRDGIVYVSNRRKSVFNTYVDADLGTMVNNLWYAEKGKGGDWRKPKILHRHLATLYHEGPATFNARGTQIFFTRQQEGERLQDKKLGIFMADRGSRGWLNIRPLPFNSSEYDIAWPTLSADGRRLYFSSNKPGGFGGYDIYVSELQGNRWGPAQNLGEAINTAFDEVYPNVHPNGNLYFSTRGHTSKGTMDLFFAEKYEDTWFVPRRLDSPFNSEFDDFSIVADMNFQSGYFTSNRDGSLNLYSFTSLIPYFEGCNQIYENNFCYVFWEETGNIDTTTYKVEWELGDGTTLKGLEVEHCYEKTGGYEISLNVYDIETGAFHERRTHFLHFVDYIEQVVITSVDTVYVNELIHFDGLETYLPEIEVDEYYWDFGDSSKGMGINTSHSFERAGFYKVILGVTSKPVRGQEVTQYCSYKIIRVLER